MGRVSTCPSCGTGEMEPFYYVRSVPTNSCILLTSPEEARAYPRGDIVLGFCPHCGFVSNVAFDPNLTEYSDRYEETQEFSPTFTAFHKDLTTRLIERFDLHDKDIIEIGCGKGAFLNLLCELGGNRGIGFDPGYVDDRVETTRAKEVKFVKDFFSKKYAQHRGDFVCCKMTLEHIPATADFIETARLAVRDQGTVVFFQVPEATRILRDCAFEDIYYEHCSYFSPGSLARLFRQNGFDILSIETEYDDQYLTIEARPLAGPKNGPLPQENDLHALRQHVATFAERCRRKLEGWRLRLKELSAKRKRVVLWGSGSKGVSFLTTLGIIDQVKYVVDINPYRQGYFMPLSGQEIVSPELLREYVPHAVIIMNPVYCDEIRRNLDRLGLKPELIPVL